MAPAVQGGIGSLLVPPFFALRKSAKGRLSPSPRKRESLASCRDKAGATTASLGNWTFNGGWVSGEVGTTADYYFKYNSGNITLGNGGTSGDADFEVFLGIDLSAGSYSNMLVKGASETTTINTLDTTIDCADGGTAGATVDFFPIDATGAGTFTGTFQHENYPITLPLGTTIWNISFPTAAEGLQVG
jgi:hypothetical protein